MEIEWKDGSTLWLPLSQLKKDNPLKNAQCAINNKIDNEPAFDWWAREVLKRSSRMIGKTKTRACARTGYKHGIKMPNTVEDALCLDEENGNDLWQKAFEKERTKVKVALKFTPEGEKAPPGYKKITGH